MDSIVFTGGLRIGESYWQAANASWPLAMLELLDDQIVIKSWFGRITLARQEILGATNYRGLISDGVQIRHTSTAAPPFVVFWIAPNKVADAFKQFGVEIQYSTQTNHGSNLRVLLSPIRFAIALLLIYVLLFVHEWHHNPNHIDAILNAGGFSLFLTTIGCVVRWRLTRS